MNGTGLTQRVFLVLVCCVAIIFLPLSAGAQGIIKKGVQGVQQGVETGAEKTKEGAEAVGHGVKKAVTGEDTSTSRMKSTETNQSTEPSQTTTPSQSTKPSGTSSTSRSTEQRARGEKLPKTAGELPLLALTGVLSLAAAGTSRLLRRLRVDK